MLLLMGGPCRSMGQEIVYCAKCASRILSSDFDKGRAFRIGNRTLCKDCALEEAPGLSADELRRASQETPRGGTPLPAATPREPLPAVTPRSCSRAVDSGPSTKTLRVLGLCGGGLLLVLLVVFAVGGSSRQRRLPPSPPAPSPSRAAAAKPPEVEDANTRAARQACEKAKGFMKERPDDLEGQIARWEEAVRTALGTAYYEEAKAARDHLLLKRMEELPRRIAGLHERARPLLEREEYKAALDVYQQARPQRETPEWTGPIDEKIREILRKVERTLEFIKERAAEDKRWGVAGEVRKALDRVRRWGFPEKLSGLEAYLSTVKEMRVSAEGLAGWWRMDEADGTSVEDSSGRGRSGIMSGSVEREKGRFGNGLSFDGLSGVVRISPGDDSVRNTFTIALWALPRAAAKMTSEGNSGVTELRGHRFAVYPAHGKNFGTGRAGIGVSSGTNGILVFEHADYHFPSPLVHQVRLSEWTHVALVYLDREPILYVNGHRARVGVRSSMEVHPSWELGGGSYGHYQGLLDDVRIYGRALADAEIQELAASDGRPWRAIFDGKTNECLRRSCREQWPVVDGALQWNGVQNAAQTVMEFDDAEIRVRFEVAGLEALRIGVRQGEGGACFVKFDGGMVRSLEGAIHEVIFKCMGESVTAALDGRQVSIHLEGKPRRGCLQITGLGRVIRILSIEYR